MTTDPSGHLRGLLIALVLSALALLGGCEERLGEVEGVRMSGWLRYESDRHLALRKPVVTVRLRNEELEGNYPIRLVDVPARWPSEGLAFDFPYILPGRYRIAASILDREALAPPVASSYLSACPLAQDGPVFEVGGEPLAGVEVVLHDRGDLAAACPGAFTDAGVGDGGGSDGGGEDPFEGFGITCEAGDNRSERGYLSADCGDNAPVCAALPSQDLGFCSRRGCDIAGGDCPPGWECMDVTAIVADAGFVCIDLSLLL